MTEQEVSSENAEGAEDETHFLQVPEVALPFQHMLEEFVRETDRGAVLIAAEIVAETLGAVITALAPPQFGKKRLRELMSYPGTIATFSSRADVAFLAGFIDHNTHSSISSLRKLRNHAAHSQTRLVLSEHQDALRAICDLGPGTSTGVNRFAAEFLLKSVVDELMERGVELEAELGSNPFSSPTDVIDELHKRPDVIKKLDDRMPRMELAFGIWLLLGLVRVQEGAARKKARP